MLGSKREDAFVHRWIWLELIWSSVAWRSVKSKEKTSVFPRDFGPFPLSSSAAFEHRSKAFHFRRERDKERPHEAWERDYDVTPRVFLSCAVKMLGYVFLEKKNTYYAILK